MTVESAKEYAKEHAKELLVTGTALGMALGAIALARRYKADIATYDIHGDLENDPYDTDPSGSS